MKTNRLTLIALSIAAAIAFSPSAHAQGDPNACSNRNAAGTYTVHCTGWTAAGPGGSLVPIIQVGVATGDTGGNWTGTASINIGGQVVLKNATVSGKTTVNSDCTGSITYNAGTPTELNIFYVMNPLSGQTTGLITDKGTVASCVLTRMTR